jgi:hypothetical protein
MKEARRRTFRGNPTQDRGEPPFICSQDFSLSWNRNVNRLSSPSISAGDEVLPSPMDFTYVNSGSKSGERKVCKTMLKIFASHTTSNFHFHFLFTEDES